MSYTVYTNKNNPHSTIHSDVDCKQIKKHDGKHNYNQGYYKSCETIEDAEQYCNSKVDDNKGNIIYCSYCKSEK